jgi:hypothetical protein
VTARARDAAGNVATSTAVAVTVSNGPPPDTAPPTVGITSPGNGATVSQTVTVSASATDNVGVSGVQFFVDGTPLGAEDTSAPYALSWNTLGASNGSHTLTARARDAAGNTASSAPVTVTVFNDTAPPTVTITAPANGATVSGTVTISASATDNVGVVGVQFFVDGAPRGAEDTAAPYSVAWDTSTVANGSHSVTARARDAAGNIATSTAATVTVSNGPPPDTMPPTVGITSPGNGATVSGTVTVSASASDNVGVVGVQFFIDGIALGAEDTTAPYSISWNTMDTANGSHTLTARARDAAGNIATSAPVSVTVSNDTTPPAVTITSPASGSTVAGTITVSATASDDVGVASVQFRLDGVDLGAPDTVAPFSISWDTTSATNASHSLTAMARDTAGNASISTPVTVTVSNATPPPTTVARVEDTDPSVTYSGVWIHGDGSRAWSGGTASYARGPAARASITFTGTQVAWIGFRGPQAGVARVFVDGALVTEIDLFSPSEAVQEPVFTSATLASGSHTVEIEATGTKNPSATDSLVAVDAFEVTPSDAAPPPPPPTTATRFEETDPSIVYSAGWQPEVTLTGWSGGSAQFTATVDARATFTFTGTGVSWLGYRGHFGGIVQVFLDGALVEEIDTFAPADEVPAVVFSRSGLAAGSHTLTVVLTGRKNPSADSSETAIDAFDVTSSESTSETSSPTATETHLEETDPLVTYSAGWMQGNTDRAWSGGTAAVSATAGAQAMLSFTGRSVRWIGFRGPQAGIARMSLDGMFVTEVDMFSTTEEVQAVVFTATDLPDATHTLTIEVTGRKNAASTNAFIAVDAFDASN